MSLAQPPSRGERSGPAPVAVSHRSAPWQRVAAAAIVLAAALLVADTLATVVRLHTALPYFDEWDDLDLFKALVNGLSPLSELFSQHNEHRIFFPRLILFADYLFLGGLGWLDLGGILVTELCHAALFVWLAGRLPGCGAVRAGAAGVVLMLLFSLRQEENFGWDYQVQFVGVFALASLSLTLFATTLAAVRRGGSGRATLIGALAIASVATFTMANGLATLAAMSLLAVLTRAPLRLVAAPLSLLLGLALAYFHSYESISEHTPLRFALAHPIPLLSYTTIYLGNFLHPSLQVSRLLGTWGLLGLGIALIVTVRRRDDDRTRLAMLGVMLFTAATAFVTGLGRMGFGVDQALSSRYAMGGAAFWSAFMIYGMSLAGVTVRPRAVATALGLTAAVLVFGAARSHAVAKRDIEDRAFQERLASAGLLLGVTDAESFGAIEDPAGPLRDLAAFLKAGDLSIFAGPDARLVGKPIADAGRRADPGFCQGTIDGVSIAPDLAAPNAARISGHAFGRRHRDIATDVYVADANDRIVGLATTLSRFEDPSGWRGFVLSPPGATVRVFVRLSDGALCPLGATTISP